MKKEVKYILGCVIAIIVISGLLILYNSEAGIYSVSQGALENPVIHENQNEPMVNNQMDVVSETEDTVISDVLVEESENRSLLMEQYIGTWNLDTLLNMMGREETLESILLLINEENITFFYEDSKYFQKFNYEIIEKPQQNEASKIWLEINAFEDNTGVRSSLSTPFGLELEVDAERIEIILHREDNIQEYAVSFSGNRSMTDQAELVNEIVTELEADTLLFTKTSEEEELFDSWIWHPLLENWYELQYMVEPIVTEYKFATNNVQTHYYDASGTLSNTFIDQCRVFNDEKVFYIFTEGTANFRIIEKIDSQTATLVTIYPFPILAHKSEPYYLKKNSSVADEIQYLSSLNGTESFTMEQVDFFDNHIKGNWKDSNGEDEQSITSILSIYTFTIGLNEFGTESREPSFYTVSEVDLQEQSVIITYTNENRGNEFFKASEPEDIVMKLQYNSNTDSIRIIAIESSSDNDFLDDIVGTEFWRFQSLN